MNAMYRSVGLSKQAFHQKLNRYLIRCSEQKQLLLLIYLIREDHPTMGIRDMYYKLKPETMGRDAFELFCKEEGLMLDRIKSYKRTTDSTGVIRFNNLLIGLKITTLNQVWQSDITYYEVGGSFYYITFIEDAFSRKVIGHNVSSRLKTEQTTLIAIKSAIKDRMKNNVNLNGLIFHSDGGGQYYDKDFLKLTAKHGIINSMCEYPWDNGKVERLNGVIKNNYLKHRKINSLEDLIKEVDRSVYLYNHEKPHINLKRMTPVMFENYYLCNGQKTDGEKSATELKTQHKGFNSPSGCGQKTSGANIALDLKLNKVN
jgi:transposase InsO family protein